MIIAIKKREDGKERRWWSKRKLEGTRAEEVFKEYYAEKNKEFLGGDIYSIHLKILLDGLSEDAHLKELIANVRSVEENIRNLAAHEIVSVTEETIVALTGFSSEKIMAMIKELFNYTGISIRKEYWNSYDEMNTEILKRMSVNE